MDNDKLAEALLKIAQELIADDSTKTAGVGYELYAKGADRIAHQTITIKDVASKLAKATRDNKSLKTRKKLIKELEKWLNVSMKELDMLKKDADNLEGWK